MTFHGSYACDDVEFLLKRVHLEPTGIAEKERLIQSGQKHYSEMISPELPPDRDYLDFFDAAMVRNRTRLAHDIVRVARCLIEHYGSNVVIASLARAGTPIGVLLCRTLRRLGCRCAHYSISIIRGRGIDAIALDHILARHSPREVAFVDGWTGKGAIAGELHSAVAAYNSSRCVELKSELYVVVDLAGVAGVAATSDDYLLPCSVLNAPISGLVSRTILNSNLVGEMDFHACVYYEELAEVDRSRWFVDALDQDIEKVLHSRLSVSSLAWSRDDCPRLQQVARYFVAEVCRRYHLRDSHRVKPGIGETTRALLRRMPSRILLRHADTEETAHVAWLAKQRGVPTERVAWLPYQAAAIIQTLGSD